MRLPLGRGVAGSRQHARSTPIDLAFGAWRVAVSRFPSTDAGIVEMYDRAAKRWDRSLYLLGYPAAYEALVRRLRAAGLLDLVPSGGRALDCGAGTGAFGLVLNVVRRDIRLLGVDVAPGMLRRARRALNDAGVDAELLHGDARALEFPDDTFDLLMTAHMLEHVPQPADAIREMTRVARPGGLVLVVMTRRGALGTLLRWMWRCHGVRPEQLATWMAGAGLAHVRLYPLSGRGPAGRMSIACVGRKVAGSARLLRQAREAGQSCPEELP